MYQYVAKRLARMEDSPDEQVDLLEDRGAAVGVAEVSVNELNGALEFEPSGVDGLPISNERAPNRRTVCTVFSGPKRGRLPGAMLPRTSPPTYLVLTCPYDFRFVWAVGNSVGPVGNEACELK